MTAVTLIVLAGGRSTRFGRPKQLEPVGANGEAILDYAVRDAFRAGCTDAIIVVRPEHEAMFASRFAEQAHVRLVLQHEACGTAHAVMLALEHTRHTAVIANADDHYGQGAIDMAVRHGTQGAMGEHALVAFRLANTLSTSGGVNRAVCEVDAEGFLVSATEVNGLRADSAGAITDELGRPWNADRLVSMNLWVLRPAILPLIQERFDAYRVAGASGEFGLPAVVHEVGARGHRFRTIPTTGSWCGLTYAADTELVRRILTARA